jgi:hypothetical protein
MSRRAFAASAASLAGLGVAAGLAGTATANAEQLEGIGTDWLGQEPETPAEFAAEYDVDVVVCGLGIAGVAALRAAAEAGASVVGFDKTGASRCSNEMSAWGSQLYAERFPDVAAFWEGAEPLILNAVTNGCICRNDIRILRRWMDVNGEAVDWYFGAVPAEEISWGTMENGNTVDADASLALKEPVYPLPEHYDPTTENMPCIPGTFRMTGSSRFLAANLAKAEEAGATYYTYTPAIKLLTDENGRVNGVVAQTEDGGYVKASAKKGVVLATGDFMSDEAMLRAFLPAVLDQGYDPATSENMYMNPDAAGNPANTGDGHRMAAWVGGKVQDFGATMSHFSKGTNSSPFGTLPLLMLDLNGNRFMNEDVQGQQFAERIRQLPQRKAVMIYDSAFDDQRGWMPYGHGKLPNNSLADAEARVEAGTAFKADTLEELLAQTDINVEQALKSIERYNELAEAGRDTDFGKVATRMFPLQNPPYYCNYMDRGDDLVTMCGIVSDADCHAYNTDLEVIEGLYLAGNVQGNRFACIYPEIFMGYSVAMAMAMGREAGLNAAAEK